MAPTINSATDGTSTGSSVGSSVGSSEGSSVEVGSLVEQAVKVKVKHKNKHRTTVNFFINIPSFKYFESSFRLYKIIVIDKVVIHFNTIF
jgi:hypothetical protein